jgi:hypothetical protein
MKANKENDHGKLNHYSSQCFLRTLPIASTMLLRLWKKLLRIKEISMTESYDLDRLPT